MKITTSRLKEIIKEELKIIRERKRVKLSQMKDANFESDYVQLMGKAGMIKLTKKDVHALAKVVRKMGGKHGMGWSFTAFEGKLNETKFYAFWNRKKHTINGKSLYDAKQKAITKLKIPKSKVGMLSVVNAKEHDRGGYRFEGKLTEASSVTLPSGNKVKIDFKGITFVKGGRGKPVFLDRTELMTFFKATRKYLYK